MEEDELLNEELKIPSDLEGDDEEEEEGELFPPDEGDSFPIDDHDDYGEELNNTGKKSKLLSESEDEEGALENVFVQANDNKEMDIVENILSKNQSEFINQEMVTKIEKIEDEMMNPKEWQLTGEARASDRPMDSLL